MRAWSSPLAAAVAGFAGVDSADALVHWAGRQSPAAFAGLAPLVCGSADPRATRIVREAARRLVGTLAELDAPDAPVVLAGGLLTADTGVRRHVLAALGDRVAGVAADPVGGAVRLAARIEGLP